MKYLHKIFIPFILLLLTVTACSSDGDDIEKKNNRENSVTYKISCNSPVAHVRVWDGKDNPIIIGNWETSFVTKGYTTEMIVTCHEDPYATLTCQLYVNGKLVCQRSDYEEVKIQYKLK
ncbi:MAG: hypothetical protein LKE47_11160 [Prevotella sp.]|nr:hypothetical protein [Prevotella sp.]MCH3970906.1 hypothetical protein [Prevotella sp.]MCI1324819.1 hypothetical protein [Prevotella sp.]MCI1349980.1 hypothetical protein [Prevotella sp.]MCI2088431.1 hypothetical protein [Prevotella sp.]MCI2125993.1 hypothetical protein [Prevotella sp.]